MKGVLSDTWVAVCRGGPTGDCGLADWHESHETRSSDETEQRAEALGCTEDCSARGAHDEPHWEGWVL